jgi:hypothetical protein
MQPIPGAGILAPIEPEQAIGGCPWGQTRGARVGCLSPKNEICIPIADFSWSAVAMSSEAPAATASDGCSERLPRRRTAPAQRGVAAEIVEASSGEMPRLGSTWP